MAFDKYVKTIQCHVKNKLESTGAPARSIKIGPPAGHIPLQISILY